MTKEYRKIKLSKIKPYPNNPRINNDAVDAVMQSIEQCGYIAPIVVDEDMVILAGHTRFKALQKIYKGHIKETEVDCVIVDGLTDEEKRKYRLLDNKTGELASWDFDLLFDELDGLDFGDLQLDFLGEPGAKGSYDPGNYDRASQGDPENPEDETDDEGLPYRYTQFWENCEKRIYAGVGAYDIPFIEGMNEIDDPGEVIGWNYAKTCTDPENKSIHFFVDDYQFYRLWNSPDTYLDLLRSFRYVFTPDFSPYANFPKAVQIFNHFRKHWLGVYWQENGIRVIPTITWSYPESYDYCFDGEPSNSVVAVSSVGCMNSKDGRKLLIDGFKEMMERLHPSCVLFYGRIPKEIEKFDVKMIRVNAFQERFHEESE